ncbi:jg7878 [Pararge aegeria aegeria]|uniref:Jg7878 protein n=1 Tax=Pararge aegeria aegeria TaxID=348720 RepID=A0A8S4S8E6_9NEOP|nr:jg7878 [Pararge aegeria aegeria]
MTSGESLGATGGMPPMTVYCGTPYRRPMSSSGRQLVEMMMVMRNNKYELLRLIIQEKIAGRRRPSWLKNLRQWFGKSTRSLLRVAASKVQIALMVANLR